MFLPSNAPPMALYTTRGNWPVWTQAWATAALRGVVMLAGLPAAKYVLHSPRTGGSSILSGGGGVGCLIFTERREMEVGCI